MKYLIISDIHGSYYYLEKVINIFNNNNFDKLIILGDILYHGPRNDLPKGYEPKKVVTLLNQYKDKIIAIKGNCDAEVDEMVLDFPLHDKLILKLNDKNILLIHGQHLKFNQEDVIDQNINFIFYGHYHIYGFKNISNIIYINPGSVSLPKEKLNHTYIIFDKKNILIKDLLDDKTLESLDI